MTFENNVKKFKDFNRTSGKLRRNFFNILIYVIRRFEKKLDLWKNDSETHLQGMSVGTTCCITQFFYLFNLSNSVQIQLQSGVFNFVTTVKIG